LDPALLYQQRTLASQKNKTTGLDGEQINALFVFGDSYTTHTGFNATPRFHLTPLI
jgi:hypothetical protein